MLFVISGKQVKILYEPVAVRCEKKQPLLPDRRRSGTSHWEFFPRRRGGLAPSRNIRVTKPFIMTASAGFKGNIL